MDELAGKYIGAYRFVARLPLDDELRDLLRRWRRVTLLRIAVGLLVASSPFWLLIPVGYFLLDPAGIETPTWLVLVWLLFTLGGGMWYSTQSAILHGVATINRRAGTFDRFELISEVAEEARAQRAIGGIPADVEIAEQVDVLTHDRRVAHAVRIGPELIRPRPVRLLHKPPRGDDPFAGCLYRRGGSPS
ncbi:MAG: hypothetical protein ACF8R7_07655 [Phycisphaerales bacterium JB039]